MSILRSSIGLLVY